MKKNKISVCLIESYFLTRTLLKRTLSSEEDFIVLNTFGDTSSCLIYLEKCRKEDLPDIILMELRVPYQKYFRTIKTIRGLYPEIKIITLTTCESEEEKIIAKTLGVSEYLFKDIEFSKLKNILRTVYQNSKDAHSVSF